jgi:hypothetical protein
MTAPAVNELLNYGLIRSHHVAAGGSATILVVGLPRSGTSMIASVMKTLGVFIGKQIDNAVFEDREIAAAIDSGRVDRFAAIAATRNAEHRVWGFKRPEAYKQLDKLCAACRNPRVIVPFRDLAAIAMRNQISMEMDALKQLPQLAADQQALLAAIGRAAVPTLLVSYEKALQFPTEVVTEIASFCGITATETAIGAAVDIIENGNARYLHASRLRFQGHVGRIRNGELHGWAKVPNRDQPRVVVDLELDGRVVQTMRADIYRPDVEKAGIGDGRYGFAFKITEEMGRGSIVCVRVQNAKTTITNSGLPLSSYLA